MINVTIAGNLGRNAELKDAGGTSVASFAVAVRQKDGTQWVSCSLWGKRGEALAQYLTKGTPVAVSGSLTLTEGNNGKSFLNVRASDVALLGHAPKSRQNDSLSCEEL